MESLRALPPDTEPAAERLKKHGGDEPATGGVMRSFARRLTLLFSAGCFGGLVNSMALWLLGKYDVTANAGVDIAPELTPSWLYPRLVWGGVWSLLFFLPFWRSSYLKRGVMVSLGPTLVQLFIIFPFKANDGWLGSKLGYLTPLLVLLLNALWGVSTVLWLRLVNERS
jgi:hypothetical protein